MAQIIVENLSKTFQIAQRRPGLLGAMRGLFSRKYHQIDALHDVGFQINEGELVGYIGPNGAGKSTTIKILSGILVPTSGRCEINGLIPWVQRHRHVARIGVVFGQRSQLWWDLPVIESFELLRDIYRVLPDEYQRQRDELIDAMQIELLLDTPVRQLSLGQRMRCDLVASLLHAPDILFLDEPTIGLDAVSKLAVRQFVSRLNKERGVTVILTTHDMDEVEALCERVVVIADGTILSDGTVADLRRQLDPERRLKVELDSEVPFAMDGVRVIKREGAVLHLAFDPGVITTTRLLAKLSEEHDIRDLLIEHPPIEELIAELYTNAGNIAGDRKPQHA